MAGPTLRSCRARQADEPSCVPVSAPRTASSTESTEYETLAASGRRIKVDRAKRVSPAERSARRAPHSQSASFSLAIDLEASGLCNCAQHIAPLRPGQASARVSRRRTIPPAPRAFQFREHARLKRGPYRFQLPGARCAPSSPRPGLAAGRRGPRLHQAFRTLP